MRKPHYWRASRATAPPAEWVFLDTEAWHGARALTAEGERQTWRCGCALAYRLDGGRRTRVARLRTTKPGDLLAFVCGRLDRRRPLWVCGHNLPYDLTLAGLWGAVCSERMTVTSCALGGSAFYIRGKLDGCPVVWIDSANYWRSPLAEVGAGVGRSKWPMPDQDDTDDEWLDYCMNDVEIVADAMDALTRHWREEGMGNWGVTSSALSFNCFRQRFMTHKVLVHDNKHALKLERDSYYGGIVDVNFVGAAPAGRVYELDVRSMYPSVCRDPLPTRLAGYSRRLGPEALKRLGEQYAVSADVTLYSTDETYPVRHGGRVIYPHGSYRTTLPGPELSEALRLGRVQSVHAAAWHHTTPAFRDCMDYWLAARAEANAGGDKCGEAICKVMANSLYGKTGQRSIIWERWGADAMRAVERAHGLPVGALAYVERHPPTLRRMEGTYITAVQGVTLRIRDYWGYLEVQVDRGESRDSVPSIAAHVTSLARLLLREMQRAAGARHWFYSDTDSLWVDDVGLKHLCDLGHVASDTPGKLSVRHEYTSFIIHSAKDYVADGEVTLKGVRADAEWLDARTVRQDTYPGAVGMMENASKPGVLVRKVERGLARGVPGKAAGAAGWTRPITLDDACPHIRYIPLDG